MCQIPLLKQLTDRSQLQWSYPKQHGRWLLSHQRNKKKLFLESLLSPPSLCVPSSALHNKSDSIQHQKPHDLWLSEHRSMVQQWSPGTTWGHRGTCTQTKHWKQEPSPGGQHTQPDSQGVSKLPVPEAPEEPLGPLNCLVLLFAETAVCFSVHHRQISRARSSMCNSK